MDHIGMDVHKRESQLCILAEGGELIERRIRTEPERFAAVLKRRYATWVGGEVEGNGGLLPRTGLRIVDLHLLA